MTWTNLENLMLSGESRQQNATYCVIPLRENVQHRQSCRDKVGRVCQKLVGKVEWVATAY